MKELCEDDVRHLREVSRSLMETNLQNADIGRLAEFEDIYRRRCRLAIRLYKDWVRCYRQETDCMHILYGSIEGILLRRQAEDAARLYWIIRQDFRAAIINHLNKSIHYAMRPKAA